nr:hypothetical protein [Tanacetum cinerariifolium]
MGEGLTMPSAPEHTPPIIQPTISKPQKKQKPRKPKRRDPEETQPSEDQGRINNEEMFDTYVLNDEEMFSESVDVVEHAKEIVADKDLIDDITLAKALMEIKVTA